MKNLLLMLLGAAALAACGQTNPEPKPIDPSGSLGLMEITFTGVGTNNLRASARAVSSGLHTQALSDVATGVEIVPIARSSFDTGTRGVDGMRHISATFKVRNASYCTPIGACSGTAYTSNRQNLTFVAVSTPTTVGTTAVATLKRFDGSSAATSIAETMIPTHSLVYDIATDAPKLNAGGEDFQAFTESEVAPLAGVLGSSVTSVFPYGFVTRCASNCAANSRRLLANPATNQFDGRVTFALKIPLQATPSDDPFTFSLMFNAVDDTVTRVTQSLEEQATPSLATARAAALNNAPIFRLPSATMTTPTTCAVRSAGTLAAPTAFAALAPTRVVSMPSLSNTLAAASAPVVANLNTPMNAAGSSSFTVSGNFAGKKSGTYSASGNNLTFTPSTSSLPGEELEVTLSNGLSSVAGNAACPYTFKYRTKSAASSGVLVTNSSSLPLTSPYSVTVGDFNADGFLDQAVLNRPSQWKISMFLGNGNGRFAAPVQYDPFFSSGSGGDLTSADVNNDGKLDLLHTGNGLSSLGVQLGNGDGTLQNQIAYPLGMPDGREIATGDLNGDGWLDVVVAGFTANSISVLLGTGSTPIFGTPTGYVYGSSTRPISVSLGDLDNDGKLDVAAANDAGQILVLFGNGDGTLRQQQMQPIALSGLTVRSVKIADFNNDQNGDLLVIHLSGFVLYLNNGNGTFAAPTGVVLGTGAFKQTVADFNGDGNLDFAVTMNPTAGTSVIVRLGNGDGTFQAAQTIPLGNLETRFIAAGDFTGDGKPDLTLNNQANNQVLMLVNDRPQFVSASWQNKMINTSGVTTFFNLPMNVPNLSQFVLHRSLMSGNTGTLQSFAANKSILLETSNPGWRNGEKFEITLTSGLSSATYNVPLFTPRVMQFQMFGGFNPTSGTYTSSSYTTGSIPFVVKSADLNGDGDMDFVSGNNTNLTVYLRNGNGTFAAPSTISLNSGEFVRGLEIADLNNDGKFDLVLGVFSTSQSLYTMLGNGNGTFQAAQTFVGAFDPSQVSIQASDLNADGKLDIVYPNGNSVYAHLGNGDGTVQAFSGYAVGTNSLSAAVADTNNDGKMDIVAANQGSSNVSVLLGNGTSGFGAASTVALLSGSAPRAIATADVNFDGNIDVVVANTDLNSVSVLIGNGDGTFPAATAGATYAVGSAPVGLSLGSFNGGLQYDIAVVNRDSSDISILYGDGTGAFATAVNTSLPASSNSFSIAMGHFDNNSVPDFVIANGGLNNTTVLLQNP